MEEFEHYFRICLQRDLSSQEARAFLKLVEEYTDTEEDDEGVIMVYHTNDDAQHCYDIRLEDDITADVGDELLEACEEMFPNDDFDLESSMGIIGETFEFGEFKLNEADRKQIAQNYNKFTHQRWIDTMVSEGWRFGLKLDESSKTHPALRPWDDLSGLHRKDQSKTIDYVIEQLEELGYKLIK
jgi:hypothetical protein